jgi:hypothetical protein
VCGNCGEKVILGGDVEGAGEEREEEVGGGQVEF